MATLPPNDADGNNDAPTGAASNDNDHTGDGGFDLLTGDGGDYFVFGPGVTVSQNDSPSEVDAASPIGQDFVDLTTYGLDPLDLASQVALAADGADAVATVDGSHVIFLFGATGIGDSDITHSDFLL